MSTSGGWQDQVGGMTNGIKYITFWSSMHQIVKVEKVEIDDATKEELNERFGLIYTGQRRLARHLFRNVVGRYIGNVPESVEALEKIQELALLMYFELELGNVDTLAQIFNKHWKLLKQLDRGSTNTCIVQIFYGVEELIDGKMICGAGGGFLQVILKKGVSRQGVSERLREVFRDSGVDVWEAELVF